MRMAPDSIPNSAWWGGVQWYMPVATAVWMLRQEDHKFKASLGYEVSQTQNKIFLKFFFSLNLDPIMTSNSAFVKIPLRGLKCLPPSLAA